MSDQNRTPNNSPNLSFFLLICSGVVIVVVALSGSPLSPLSSSSSLSQSSLMTTAQFNNFFAEAADGDPIPLDADDESDAADAP